MDNFKNLLREYRKRKNLSMSKLARGIGVHPSLLSRLESGERNPSSRDFVIRLAENLGLRNEEKNKILISAGYFPSLAFINKLENQNEQYISGLGLADLPLENKSGYDLLKKVAEIINDEETDEEMMTLIESVLTLIIKQHK